MNPPLYATPPPPEKRRQFFSTKPSGEGFVHVADRSGAPLCGIAGNVWQMVIGPPNCRRCKKLMAAIVDA